MHNNEAKDTHGAHLALHGKQGQQSASEVIETCSTLCARISRCYQSPIKGGL